MSLIHGSQGLIYFCHQFKPKFIEAGLLADEEMAKAVGATNRRIHELAPVINSAPLKERVTVQCEPNSVSQEMAKLLGDGPVALAARSQGGSLYVLSVRVEKEPVQATFSLRGVNGPADVEVLGENRRLKAEGVGGEVRGPAGYVVLGENRHLKAEGGRFTDHFAGYEVHLYRITAK
jgi:hypothetical protein